VAEPEVAEPEVAEPEVAEPEVAEPEVAEPGIELGHSEVDQEPVVWTPTVRGSPHLFILGIPGQGKSWTVSRILLELTRHGVPALVFDFHGQFAPGGSASSVLHPNVLLMNASAGVPLSPFEAEAGTSAGASFWKTNAYSVAEIFQYVCGLGDIQFDLVYQAIRDCYEIHGFGGEDPSGLPSVDEVADRIAHLEEAKRTPNVTARVRPLLEFDLFASDLPGEDWDRRMEFGAVLDVSGIGLEKVQLAISAFMLRKVYKDMFKWGETDHLRLVVVLDEAHRLAKDITLPKIMKEGRKFGVGVLVASQGLADFHQDVVGNAGTKIVFRTNFPMSRKVASFFRSDRKVDLAALIEQLDVGEAYVQTPEMDRALRVRMHPLE
jgi:DNA helicase HerA-like ATPase